MNVKFSKCLYLYVDSLIILHDDYREKFVFTLHVHKYRYKVNIVHNSMVCTSLVLEYLGERLEFCCRLYHS